MTMRDVSHLEGLNLDPLHDQTVLITGASGLIGTWLLDSLVRLRLKKRGVLRVFAQVHRSPSAALQRQADEHGFQILRLDLADYYDYGFLPCADLIIHAAGPAQPADFLARPAETFSVNTAGTRALLERLNPGGRFLFCSSNAVYVGRDGILTEDDIGTSTPADARAGYIEGKRGGETLVYIARAQGAEARIVRLGATYGPGTRRDDQRALNVFIRQAICQQRIDLLDSGAAVRTYLYVADAVEMLWRIVLEGTQAVYNLCGRKAVAVATAAETIGRLTGVVVHYPPGVNGESMPGGTAELWRDTTRLDVEFGKTEYVALADGLQRTIDWQRDLYHGAGL